MKKVGQLLKEARVQKNLSIQDIAFALKISGRTLVALEDGDEKELPARAFVRGFAKSYAKYLKLESADFTFAFQTEFGEPDAKRNMATTTVTPSIPAPAETAPLKRTETTTAVDGSKKVEVEDELSQLNHDGSKATLIYGALALALVIMIGVAQRVIEKYQKETLVSESEKQAAASTITPVDTTKKQEPAPLSSASTTPTADTSLAASSSNSTAPISAPPATTSAAPEATIATNPTTTQSTSETKPATMKDPKTDTASENKPLPSAEVKPATPVATSEVKKETTAPSLTKKLDPKLDVTASVFKMASVEVVIEALGNIEIEYSSKSDGKGKLKLAKGQLHIFKSKNGLRVSISDGGLAKLAVNGKDVGVAGSAGKSVSITY